MLTRTEYNDAYSNAVFKAFEERLRPLLAQVAPDWMLHHMELCRRFEEDTLDERVEIRLVIKPIISARFAPDRPELQPPNLLLGARGEK